MARLTNDQVVGIVLIVVGAFAAFGFLSEVVATIAAVALILLGVLVLRGNVKWAAWIGISCLAGGILLLFNWLDVLSELVNVATVLVGVLMVILGIVKLSVKTA